jgi:hypothetical protein
MPTIVTRYVDTRSTAGGNGTTPSTGSGDANRAFNNLSASLAATSASFPNLVSTDTLLKIECAGGLDTSSGTHSPNFITDDSRYLWITANSSSRSNGTWDGSKYTIATPGNNTSVIAINNVKNLVLEGLQIENRTSVGTYVVISLTDAITQDRTLSIVDCYLRATSGSESGGVGGTVGAAINYPYNIRKSLTVVNTVIHGKFSRGIDAGGSLSGSKFAIYNNTIYDVSGSGISVAGFASFTTTSMYNNIVISSRPDTLAYATSSVAGNFFENNISSDNSSPSTNLRNITVPFVDPATGNFNLTDRSSPAVNTGTNLSTDILYPFATDIAGNIRGTGRGGRSWDIGALEYQRPANIVVRNIDNTANILFSDNFNRADGSIGSNYQICSGSTSLMTIFNGTISTPTGVQFNCVSTGSLLFPVDCEAELTYTALNNFDYMGPAVRINPTNGTGYTIRYLPETQVLQIGTVVGRTYTSLLGVTRRVSVGDKLTLQAIGNILTAFYNGSRVFSVTNNSYTSGQAGFFYIPDNVRGTRVDDFKVRSITNTSRITATGTRGRIIGSTTWG